MQLKDFIMYTGELVTVLGIQTGYLYDVRDTEKKYPYPIQKNPESSSVIKPFPDWNSLKEHIEDENFNLDHLCFLVLKNADFSGGTGPMVAHRLFKHIYDAELYISEQMGICGSEQNHWINSGENINGGIYASVYWNGYRIQQLVLEETF